MTTLTRPCELVFLEDSSSGDQDRLRAFVFSPAETLEERAATAMVAAASLIRSSGYDFAQVFLMPMEAPRQRDLLPMSNAEARFAPVPSRIPFQDQRWELRDNEQPFSETLYIAAMEDMSDFAMEYDRSAGPRQGCSPVPRWTP